MKPADLPDALFRRRMAITQAEALIRQAEANAVHTTIAENSPELKRFACIWAIQAARLMSEADRILQQAVEP